MATYRAAYLTVNEMFPLEIRALATTIFYAIGTLLGAVGARSLFGMLIASSSCWNVGYGYLLGAGFMIAGALEEWRYGIETVGR